MSTSFNIFKDHELTLHSVPVTPTTPAGTPGATPPAYTGAANALNAAGVFAGFGAVAAFFF